MLHVPIKLDKSEIPLDWLDLLMGSGIGGLEMIPALSKMSTLFPQSGAGHALGVPRKSFFRYKDV